MSAESTRCLALRLEGPLQAWGTESRFNRRTTGLMPSKSGVIGLLCAALGLERGSAEEAAALGTFAGCPMLAVAVPRHAPGGYARNGAAVLAVSRMEDYHTVQHTVRAEGKTKDCHLTRRQYVQDAAFMVFLSGDRALLERAARAVQNPVWGVWLGRKACIPSAPVFGGLFADVAEAAGHLLDAPLVAYTRVSEAASFADGQDMLFDTPVSFLSAQRRFVPRRVRTISAGQEG